MEATAARDACSKAADASINNVFREVRDSQKMLNRLPNGRTCATRNQHLINQAQRLVQTRKKQLRKARNNLAAARRARVSWNFSYESVTEGRCGRFFRAAGWQNAKRRVNSRQRNVNNANANLRAANLNLQNQIATAKRVRNRCRCNVQKNTKRQLSIAKRMTADRQKTILREMMVKCLVAARSKGKAANAAAAKCKALRIPSGYIRRLSLRRTKWAAGVSGARCGGRSTGEVRLVDKAGRVVTNSGRGILQTRVAGSWGYACDDSWHNKKWANNNIQVSCRALGFSGGVWNKSGNCGKSNGIYHHGGFPRALRSTVDRYCKKIRNQQFNSEEMRCASSSYRRISQCGNGNPRARLGQSFCSWSEQIFLTCQ